MARILKYPLAIDDEWHDIPRPFVQPLTQRAMWHCGMQKDTVMLWLRPANPDDPYSNTDPLKVVGTGHEYEDKDSYVCSVQDPRGFVWHVIARDDG